MTLVAVCLSLRYTLVMFHRHEIRNTVRPFVSFVSLKKKVVFVSKFYVRGFSSSTIHQRCQPLEMKNGEID